MVDEGDGSASRGVDDARAAAVSQWERWARTNLSVDEAASRAAAEAAINSLERGSTTEVAAAMALIAAGVPPERYLRTVYIQRNRSAASLEEINGISPGGALTSDGIAHLRHVLEMRITTADTFLASAAARPPPGAWAHSPQSRVPFPGSVPLQAYAGHPTPPHSFPGPSPSSQRPVNSDVHPGESGKPPGGFTSDLGVQLLAYTGAFLLMIATVLFEAYGAPPGQQVLRLLALAALDAMFAIGAAICRRYERLAMVGTVYLGVASLLFPLVLVAEGFALHVGTTGISPATALFAGAFVCMMLYGALAFSTGSLAYGALAAVALAISWSSALVAAHAGIWDGAGFAPIAIVYGALGHRSTGEGTPSTRRLRMPRQLAEPLAFSGATIAVAWSAPYATPRACTLVVVTLELALACWYYRRSNLVWLVAAGTSLSVLAIGLAFNGGRVASGGELAFLSVLFAWAASSTSLQPVLERLPWPARSQAPQQPPQFPWSPQPPPQALPRSGVESFLEFLRVASVIQALATLFLIVAHPWWLEASVLLVAAASPTFIAVRNRRPNLLFGTGAILSTAWLFLALGAQSLGLHLGLHLQTRSGHLSGLAPGPVASAYLPLGFILAGAALIISLRSGREWAAPAYTFAGLVGFTVVFLALATHRDVLAGGLLLACAVAVELIASLERVPQVGAMAIALLAAATVSVLAGEGATGRTYPLALAAVCTIGYLSGVVIGTLFPRAGASPRYSPLADSGGSALPPEGHSRAPTTLSQGTPRAAREIGMEERTGSLLDHGTAHRSGAIIGMSILAAVMLVDSHTWIHRNDALLPITAGILAVLALDLALERRLRGPWWLAWASPVIASLISLPLARIAGATDPQWYVLGPGLCLILVGIVMPAIERAPGSIQAARTLAAAGLALLAGTTAVQMVAVHRLGVYAPPPTVTVPLLVAEGVVSLFAGIALRRRVPVIGGAAAIAAGGLWALGDAARGLPLFTFLATLGLLLIGLATVLVTKRDHVAAVRQNIRHAWRTWA